MGPEDRVDNTQDLPEVQVSSSNMEGAIPGLDFDMDDKNCKQPLMKKVFSSPPTHLMLLQQLHELLLMISDPLLFHFNIIWLVLISEVGLSDEHETRSSNNLPLSLTSNKFFQSQSRLSLLFLTFTNLSL